MMMMMMMMMMIMITTMRISFTAISLVQQVAQRFRDNSIAQDLEQVGFRLEGMPDASPPTIAHVSNADVRNAERQNINRRKVSRYVAVQIQLRRARASSTFERHQDCLVTG